MNYSLDRESVFEQLKIDEGVKYEVYLDHLGNPTFGVGHLIDDDEPEYWCDVGTSVSEERVWSVFNSDLNVAIIECKALYGSGTFHRFPSEVQEVIINMMFNMGRTRLSKFKKMNSHLYDRDWKLAAAEGRDSLWYNQVTARAERLMTRLENV